MSTKQSKTTTMGQCPGCSSTRGRETDVVGVYECAKCGGVVGQCYRGDASRFVAIHQPMQAECEDGDARYFDLMLLGSQGIERVHGWMDRNTKRVVQFG
jgi:transcription initiation factor TFIIIB Brf1 subunit/transcription initiation factor TFIIB